MPFRIKRIPHYIKNYKTYIRLYINQIWISFSSCVMDVRYGGKSLKGNIPTRYGSEGAFRTQNTEYRFLKEIFSIYHLKSDDVFMDVGCGKGRVINFLLWNQFPGEIHGVELDCDIASFTSDRLKKTKARISAGNILDHIQREITVYYLFNPFNRSVMEKFILKIEGVHDIVDIIYYFPVYKACFLNRKGWSWSEYELKSNGNKLLILHYQKSQGLGELTRSSALF